MAQSLPEWEEIPEFNSIARKLVEKTPELSHVDSDIVIAYKCTNKTQPKSKQLPYDISGQGNPEAFTNSKKYFVKVCYDIWDNMPVNNRQVLVLHALKRIHPEKPDSGKVVGCDLKDHTDIVRTFGVDWAVSTNVPDILNERVSLISEPEFT